MLEIVNNGNIAKQNVPRTLPTGNKILGSELYRFSDAGSLAYGANIYLRTPYKSAFIENNLICSKSRLAPIKSILSQVSNY